MLLEESLGICNPRVRFNRNPLPAQSFLLVLDEVDIVILSGLRTDGFPVLDNPCVLVTGDRDRVRVLRRGD